MSALAKSWKKLSSRERKYIVIALLLAAIYIIANYVYDPLKSIYNSNRSELETQAVLLKRSEQLVKNADRTREKLRKSIGMETAIKSVLLDNQTPDLANAELQGLVKNLAQKANITFTSINSTKVAAKGNYSEIGVNVIFTAKIHQILKFIYELETAERFLDIQQLSIKSQRRNKTNLQVDLSITAYIAADQTQTPDETVKETARKMES